MPLDELAPRTASGRSSSHGGERHPLLAFGSNGAPERLALKFNDLPDDERELLVLAGHLHGLRRRRGPDADVLRRAARDALPQPGRRCPRLAAAGRATRSSRARPGAS